MTSTTPHERPYGRLDEALSSGRFVVTCELPPPRGASTTAIRRSARTLKGVIDAANVTDGQSATVRLASWAGALAIQQEGLEPVMQLQCRDRNRIALQADLLGAAALGIPNVNLMTGDDPAAGDHPEAKGVFDLDAVGLIAAAKKLRDEKQTLSGRRLTGAPRWVIGCVEDPFGRGDRVQRLREKVEAGAEFVQTQYVFDLPAFERWLQQVRDEGLDERCKILAGVGPLRTRRALEFLAKELPGVHIPSEVSERLLAVPEDRMAEEAMSLCAETVQALHEMKGVAGVHIVAPGWDERIPELLQRAGVRRETT